LIHKNKPTVLFFITFISFLPLSAKTEAKPGSDIYNALKNLQVCHYKFEKKFKFPRRQDTITEQYSSTINLLGEIEGGWHEVYYASAQTRKGLVAYNETKLSRLNTKDDYFYTVHKSENESMFHNQLLQYQYTPFFRSEAEWNKFEKIDKTTEYIIYQLVDSIAGKGRSKSIPVVTTVRVRRSDNILVYESVVTGFSGAEQYSSVELKEYSANILTQTKYKSSLDSVFQFIHSHIDADSVKQAALNRYRDLKVGDTVQLNSLLNTNSELINLEDYHDSIVILDFFHTACSPCLKSIPELNRIYAATRQQGVCVFGIDPIGSDKPKLSAYVQRMKIQYPVLMADKEMVYAFGVKYYPRLFILYQGKVMKIMYGYSKAYEEEILKFVQEIKR